MTLMRVLRSVGRASPLMLTLLCTGAGLYIFRDVPPEVQQGTGVRAASIFRTAVLVLLWRVKIYPTSLQKLTRFMHLLVEFLLAMFIVEYLQADFWIPLEAAIRKVLKLISDYSADTMNSLVQIDIGEYTAYMTNEWTICFIVYGVSLFLLISALHGTKAIDLREMKYGPEPFVYAIMATIRKYQQLLAAQKAHNARAAEQQRARITNSNPYNKDRDDDQQKAIEYKKNGDQKSLEYRRETDQSSFFGDGFSDFEMDCN